MPRKAVKSLYQTALDVVSQNIWKFVKEHGNTSCETCLLPQQCSECTSMKTVKKTVTLPPTVTQDVYDTIHSYWNTDSLSSRIKEKLSFLFVCLLHTPELKIQEFRLTKTDDFYFAVKFGKNVQSLFCKECPTEIYENERLWQSFMFYMSNIHTLNLEYVTLSDDMLARVGRECFHLKFLDRLELIKDKYSLDLFEGLCQRYQDGKCIQNHCCKNLEVIDVWKYCTYKGRCNQPTVLQSKMNEFVPFLLKTLPNLKSLGDSFDANKYLESVDSIKILKTSLERAIVTRVPPLLQVMCPKLRELKVLISASWDVAGLVLFNNLEKLTITKKGLSEYPQSISVDYLHKDVICCKWANLREFDSSYPVHALKICVLAKCLPSLETLYFRYFVTTEWDGVSHFKSLKKALFLMYEVHNLSWVSSFSSTIESLSIDKTDLPSPMDFFSNVSCAIFTTAHFPFLEELRISSFNYDFQFITNIIQHCNMLRKIEIPVNNEERMALSEFATQNNFDVVFPCLS